MTQKNEDSNSVKKSHPRTIEKHIHFEIIDSTNTWAKKNSDQWSTSGITLVTASGQTQGRGRFNRKWESPNNVNIYSTFCFWVDLNRTDCGYIPQLLALAAADALQQLQFIPEIKWPNDLLLSKKKVAGVLCETICEETRKGVVCGIGLNVNMPSELLDLIDRPATSLFAERGEKFDLILIQNSLQNLFVSILNEFEVFGYAPFFPRLTSYSTFKKGDNVRFHDNHIILEGKFEAWCSDGSLELRLPNGKTRKFLVGEFVT